MDEQAFRQFLQDHGDAVVRGDDARVLADIDPSLHAGVGAVAARLPRPVTRAEVLSVEPEGEARRATIRYSGADSSLVLRSLWRQVDSPQPLIVELEPVP